MPTSDPRLQNTSPEEIRRLAEERGVLPWHLLQLASSEIMRWAQRDHGLSLERQAGLGGPAQEVVKALNHIGDVAAKYRAQVEAHAGLALPPSRPLADRFERIASGARLPSRVELDALDEAAQELAEPAREVTEAAGEVTAALEILAPDSGYDREGKAEARANLKEAAGKLAAALRELEGVMF